MRKITEQNRRHFQRKSIQGSQRKHRMRRRVQRDRVARHDFIKWRAKLPEVKLSHTKYEKFATFDPPKCFSIYNNFEKTLGFLLDFRSLFMLNNHSGVKRRKTLFADFSTIEELDAASGLLLAAEVDRWRRVVNKKPISHDHLWHENVRDFFHDAGLFELLGIDPRTARSTASTGVKRRTLRYQTGVLHQGRTADLFRSELEALIGKQIGPKAQVYDALSEAMTNVANHAYPRDIPLWPPGQKGRWWLGGSWEPDRRIATVQFYDQGVGIPRTLPRSRHWYHVLPIFGRIDREHTDAGMIEAAMDYGRTSTGEAGRGKGLAQMAQWISAAGNGSLRILSGRGSLTYLPGERPVRRNLPVEFRGTLVEWEIHL